MMAKKSFDVVTGGAGFIGSHLVDALLAAGGAVKAVDNLSVGRLKNLVQHTDNPDFEFVEADVADRQRMQGELSGARRVYHLAALADIVPSIEKPLGYHDANVNGTISVLEASREAAVERFLYVASSSCYGIPDTYPTAESAPIRPQYPYALSKYLGEQLVHHWAQVYDMPAVSVRLFNIYGPRARTAGTYGAMFGVFLAQLIAGEPLTIVGDGTQSRDFTFVSDAVDAILCVAEKAAAGSFYNAGTGVDVSVNRIVELLGTKETVTIPKRPGEPDITLADISKIKAELGWQPAVTIEEGVGIMLENLDYWRDAPVWTAESISRATESWFKYLGSQTAAGADRG